MIQYIIAAGIGAFLGSRSKKSKKSYAHGGEVQSWLKKYDDSRKKLGIDHPTTRYWGGYYDGIYALEDGNAMSKDVALKKYNSISEKLGSDHPTTNFWGGYYDAILDQNSYAKGGVVNGKYLDSISADKKSKILNNIAKHYGISSKEAEEEVVDLDAENLFEYIANDNSLRMQVYNDFKRKNYAEGGSVDEYEFNKIDNRIYENEEIIEALKRRKKLLLRTPEEVKSDLEGRYGQYATRSHNFAKGGYVMDDYNDTLPNGITLTDIRMENEGVELTGQEFQLFDTETGETEYLDNEDDLFDKYDGERYDAKTVWYYTYDGEDLRYEERYDGYAKGGKTNFEIPFSFNVSDVKTQLKKQGYSEAKINKAFQGVNVSMSKDFKENIVDAKGLLDNLPTQDYRELAMNVPATVLGMQKRNK